MYTACKYIGQVHLFLAVCFCNCSPCFHCPFDACCHMLTKTGVSQTRFSYSACMEPARSPPGSHHAPGGTGHRRQAHRRLPAALHRCRPVCHCSRRVYRARRRAPLHCRRAHAAARDKDARTCPGLPVCAAGHAARRAVGAVRPLHRVLLGSGAGGATGLHRHERVGWGAQGARRPVHALGDGGRGGGGGRHWTAGMAGVAHDRHGAPDRRVSVCLHECHRTLHHRPPSMPRALALPPAPRPPPPCTPPTPRPGLWHGASSCSTRNLLPCCLPRHSSLTWQSALRHQTPRQHAQRYVCGACCCRGGGAPVAALGGCWRPDTITRCCGIVAGMTTLLHPARWMMREAC